MKKAIKDGLSEDLEKDAENDLQKLHDKYIKQLENLMDEKEKKIISVEDKWLMDNNLDEGDEWPENLLNKLRR